MTELPPQELTPTQRSQIQSALQSLKEELQTFLRAATEGAKPVDLDQPIGRLSRMDAMQQQAMVTENRRRAASRLRLVEAALTVDADELGICKRCDESIAFGRLLVRPESPFCVACQNRAERGY